MFGWVSREQHDQALARVDALEKERRELIDRLLLQNGQAPIYAPVVTPAPPPEPESKGEPAKPFRRKVSFDEVTSAAQLAANEGKLGVVPAPRVMGER